LRGSQGALHRVGEKTQIEIKATTCAETKGELMLFGPITTISINELLKLWGELVECYYGVHGYGGDKAEIYAYRLQQYSPRAHIHRDQQAQQECANMAAGALVALCQSFEAEYNCRIEIDDMSLNSWLAMSQIGGAPFNHRAYIVVEPRKKKPNADAA
jgi:hypothetical protein